LDGAAASSDIVATVISSARTLSGASLSLGIVIRSRPQVTGGNFEVLFKGLRGGTWSPRSKLD
jgi:hypothetical protein